MALPSKEEVDVASDVLLDGSYCTTIDDFFSLPARDLIGRFLAAFLDPLVLTPTELVHSAKAQKRLNDAGRTMLNAVDKVATLQARYKGESAAKRVKELHTLISAATKKIYDDEKDKPIPSLTAEGFSSFAAGIRAGDKERDYLINRALTEFLSQFKVWKDKIAVLIRIIAMTKGREECRFAEIVLAECLKSDPAVDQLFGMPERLESRCADLLDLWKGEWKMHDAAAEVVVEINALHAGGTLPSLKGAIEYSLLRTLAGKMPIRSAEPEQELQALFDLFKRMWLNGSLVGGAKTLAMLEKRQARYINNETVTDLLRERKVMADRLAYLMQLSTMAIGQSNRNTLKIFIEHYFGDRDFLPRIVAGQELPVPKLQTLSTIHRTLRASWLSDGDKATYMAVVETAQAEMLKRSRIFEQIDKKGGGPSQKVLTILDMCRKGTFIDGRNLDTVRQVLEKHLQTPEFLPDYLGHASGEERERKLALLIKTLSAFGIRYNA